MNAVIFPGHGSQYCGMGKELYDNFPRAREVFEYVDELLGMEISRICFQGEEELKDVYTQQLAITAVSLAAYELFREKNVEIDFCSGLSLGEYISLYPAGVLSFEDVVRLVKFRAEATRKASSIYPCSMLAVIRLEGYYRSVLAVEKDLYIANINSPKQLVVTVKDENKQKAVSRLKAFGAKVVELEIDGGFHSPYMEQAKRQFAESISVLEFNRAKLPVVSNYTAKAHFEGDEIRDNLAEQLTSTALWQDCVEYMIKNGVNTFFELGPSRILNGLIKKINANARVINMENKDDVNKFFSENYHLERELEALNGKV